MRAKMDVENFTTVTKVSRPPGWTFGPILYTIGLIHSPSGLAFLGKTRACLQLLSLSFPLALGVYPYLLLSAGHKELEF